MSLRLVFETRLVLLACLMLVGSGCVRLPFYSAANIEMPPSHFWGVPPSTRASAVIDSSNLAKGVFVGVALSGGGSRAANFSAATLLELEELGFLRHVTSVSSVSGGSLAAGYYGLFGNDPKRWNPIMVREVFRKNLEVRMIVRLALPHNLVRIAFTDFDKTDLLADVFDDVLFENRTFDDMPREGPRIVVNSTVDSATPNLVQFGFTDEEFASIGSDLSKFRVSKAVAASGAFPGAFDSVTLQVYGARLPMVDDPVPARYIHVMDGGPADNLGVDSLLRQVRDTAARGHSLRACFIFVVDAAAGSDIERLQESMARDSRSSTLDTVFSSNAFRAIDTMMARRRIDTLAGLGLGLESFGEFEVSVPEGRVGARKQVSCAAWHIRINGAVGKQGSFDPFAILSRDALARFQKTGPQQARVSAAVTSLIGYLPTEPWGGEAGTRYQVTSPWKLSAAELQEALFVGARRAIRGDRSTLKRACAWFDQHDVEVEWCRARTRLE